ncbi:MAG: acetylglutamate kinase [Phycisphaerae bacterium]|nr:MAG: acetylglutamate kinase [Phycisphaerae bacterium]
MSTGPMVIKVGGTTLEDQRTAPALWKAVADLHRSHAGGVVLVHGGGKAVDAHLARLGFTTERREGIRITPADQLEEIVAVLAGRINKSLVGALARVGVKAVGLCLGDGGSIPTVKSARYGFDPGRVGEVVPNAADAGALLRVLLRHGYLPVLSSIGLDAAGEFLNINADDAAAGVAGALAADTLVLLTDVPGILDAERRVIPETTPGAIDAMIASGVIAGGMIPKVRAAADAASATRAPVIILSGNDPEAFASWTAGKPVGTRVLPARGR